MGYCMSRYDDTRLDGPGSIETRTESFYLRMPGIDVYGETEDVGTVEISYDAVPRVLELIAVAMANGVGEGELHPPSEEQAEAWRQEEEDATLLADGNGFTDDDLRRLLVLRSKAPSGETP